MCGGVCAWGYMLIIMALQDLGNYEWVQGQPGLHLNGDRGLDCFLTWLLHSKAYSRKGLC